MNRSRFLGLACAQFCLAVFFLSSATTNHAQSSTAPASSLEPGPQPTDAPAQWKQLVGIYGPGKEPSVIILERYQKLIWLADKRESEIFPDSRDNTKFLRDDGIAFFIDTAPSGGITRLTVPGRESPLLRADAGADPASFYHITPAHPVEQLRAAALAARPPKEPGPFRKADLVELITLGPTFHLDIRYATANDFLGTPVYTQARAFLQRPAADALLRVLHKLQPLGYGLLIHDAYRPWYVTKIFWDVTPTTGRIFVADPAKGSKHNRGCAVDLTLYDIASGQPIEMPGLYDEMSPRSFPTFPGGTSLQRWHRDLLRRAMESEAFAVNEDEWWHFDYKDWQHYQILNVPFEKLAGSTATK